MAVPGWGGFRFGSEFVAGRLPDFRTSGRMPSIRLLHGSQGWRERDWPREGLEQ